MRFRRFRHSLVSHLIWLLTSLLRPLPFGVTRVLVGFLGTLFYAILGGHRRLAMRHLELAFGDALSPRDRKRLVRRLFRNYGYGAAECLQFPKGDSFFRSLHMAVEGREHLDWAVRKGKGCVFVTAHAGNWELLAAWLAREGYPVNVVARPARHAHVEELLRRHREAAGVRVFSKYASALAMVRVLRRGEGLGILSDVDTRGEGIFVEFFGRPAFTPTGPARLAARTGAPLIVGFTAREGVRAHRIAVRPPVWVVDGKPERADEKDIPSAVEYYTREIERWVREYPDQWIWTHPRWKTRLAAEEDQA